MPDSLFLGINIPCALIDKLFDLIPLCNPVVALL